MTSINNMPASASLNSTNSSSDLSESDDNSQPDQKYPDIEKSPLSGLLLESVLISQPKLKIHKS